MKFEPIHAGCCCGKRRCRLFPIARTLSGRLEKFQGVGGLGFGHLDAKHPRRRIGAETAEPGGVFVGNKGMKICGLEPGAGQLRFRQIESGEDGGKVHIKFAGVQASA